MNWLVEQIRWLISLARPENLRELVNFGGPPWVSYAILGAIVFSETGLLVGFFLPGDSLLFAAGFLASQKVFDIVWLNVVLITAGILGHAVNYFLGREMSSHVLEKGRIRFVRPSHIEAAHAFYERHGGLAVVLSRFVPVVRTFTPFVAGVAGMNFGRFMVYNVAGGIAWIALLTMAGYWLGQREFVAQHFELIMLAIVAVSLIPVFIGAWRTWRGKPLVDEESDASLAEPTRSGK